jgi:acyl-CoA dehydrogenase
MRIDLYAARSALYRTARLAESGEDVVNEAAATKVLCTETIGRVVDTAVQLAGGQALIEGEALEQMYRRVRSLRFVGGASDILRLSIARGIFDFDSGRV